MINIEQIIDILGYIAVTAAMLALLGVIIWSVVWGILDIKEKNAEKKYWIIKYKVYAECYGTACVKARSKAEAIYKFCNEFEVGKTAVIEDVKEVPNE